MGKTVRGPIGPPGPSGPSGPPGLPRSSDGICRSVNHANVNIRPLTCPLSVPTRQAIETTFFEAGSLIYLQEESKLVLKTSSAGWVELQVSLLMILTEAPPSIFFFWARQAQPMRSASRVKTTTASSSSHSLTHNESTKDENPTTPLWRPPPPAPRSSDKVKM